MKAINKQDEALRARVCAVVVTYKRKALLRQCLDALLGQTRAVEEILVVDNRSDDGTVEMVAVDFPGAKLLKLSENMGGAGGFYEGIKESLKGKFDWVWIMDDDGIPAPDCLEKLLAHSRRNSVMVPVQQDEDGGRHGVMVWDGRVDIDRTEQIIAGSHPVTGNFVFTFVGPMLSREIIEAVGLPVKEFFIFFDDSEYSLRIQEAGGEIIIVPDAVMSHPHGKPRPVRFLWHSRSRNLAIPWKCYYSTRNSLYVQTRGGRPRQELLNYSFAQFKHLLGDVLYEPRRWECLRMHARALWDGARGNLGKRVVPG